MAIRLPTPQYTATYIADFPTILVCFHQHHKHLYRGGGWWVVGSREVAGYSKAQ